MEVVADPSFRKSQINKILAYSIQGSVNNNKDDQRRVLGFIEHPVKLGPR